ncbi:MAG: hypothetical protein LQ346_000576 [Caloplaca aetnensis]|nr:MAG: hypothetical protein LQ346_000576 [Caloplaca aetnensis]
MSEELQNEIEAINAIYGAQTIQNLVDAKSCGQYSLRIQQVEVTLRLSIPHQYPETCLQVTAVEGVGSASKKGLGNYVLETARDLVQRIFTPGQVCLFDLLQELEQSLDQVSPTSMKEHVEGSEHSDAELEHEIKSAEEVGDNNLAPPHWVLSATVTVKKSVFIARACTVKTTKEAQSAIAHLLATDKRTSKATHNISAYRIRSLIEGKEMVFQDCDDDGEDAAGGRLLKLLQMMDVWNVLVVVSRWYGGVKLGPARFGIINAVAREAIVAGRFIKS